MQANGWAAGDALFVDDSKEVARSRALDEEGEWKKKTGEADDADIERVRSQVMSADEKRRRRRDRG